MKTTEPPLYRVSLEGAVLWRDGRRAVVSLKLDGLWLRILEADTEGMFHVEQSAEALRLDLLGALTALGLQRRCHRPGVPGGRTRRAQALSQKRKAARHDAPQALP